MPSRGDLSRIGTARRSRQRDSSPSRSFVARDACAAREPLSKRWSFDHRADANSVQRAQPLAVDSIANSRYQSVTDITDHLARVTRRVRDALIEAGRPEDAVTIVAVSKLQPATAIEAAFRAGQRHFGESYVQEALAKMELVRELPIEWHFIGRIQANKTRAIARHFQWVHTVDRLRIAMRLNEQRPHFAPPLNVLLQVNQAGESQKGGVAEAELEGLARAVAGLPRLRLRGLMSIPPAGGTAAETTGLFARLRELRDGLLASGLDVDTLSMGMSADYELAVEEGATMVRIGTAIFGPREQ
jgi:PLP dependent protein